MSVQHDPNVSMLPSVGGGPIVAMSGGGGAEGGNNAGNEELTIEGLNAEIAKKEAETAEIEAEILRESDNAAPSAPSAPAPPAPAAASAATPQLVKKEDLVAIATKLARTAISSSASATPSNAAPSASSAAPSNAPAAPAAAADKATAYKAAPTSVQFLDGLTKFMLHRMFSSPRPSKELSDALNKDALSFLNEIGKTVQLPTGAEPKIQIDIYKYTPPTMRWADPSSKNSIFLKQSNGTEILLSTLDCISFYREHEPYTIAYILQFLPVEGNEPPNQFTFRPFRKDTTSWATTNVPITRTGWFVKDSTELNSIKIMNEPPIEIPE